jgi:hypothetical protein
VPADDDVPDPAACEPVGQSVGQGYCYMQEICGGSYQYTNCSDQGTGSYLCSCQTNYGASATFELTGVDQSTACTKVKDYCDQGTVEFTGDPVCTEPSMTVSTDYCDISQVCSIAVPIADGVSAVQQTYSNTSCSRYYGYTPEGMMVDGTLQCWCSDNNISKSYIVTGIPASSACTQLQLCGDNPSIVLPEPTCEITNNSSSTTYCDLQRQCSQSVTTPEGGTVDVSQYEYASCQISGGIGSCSCQNSSRYLSFGMDVSASSEACSVAMSVCDSDEEILPEGEISCATSSQSAGQDYCNAQIECGQEAVVSDTTISMRGYMQVSCSPTGDEGSFQCSCSSNVDSAQLNVEASTDWDACSAAAEQCPELVDIDISAGGNPYGYPIPL